MIDILKEIPFADFKGQKYCTDRDVVKFYGITNNRVLGRYMGATKETFQKLGLVHLQNRYENRKYAEILSEEDRKRKFYLWTPECVIELAKFINTPVAKQLREELNLPEQFKNPRLYKERIPVDLEGVDPVDFAIYSILKKHHPILVGRHGNNLYTLSGEIATLVKRKARSVCFVPSNYPDSYRSIGFYRFYDLKNADELRRQLRIVNSDTRLWSMKSVAFSMRFITSKVAKELNAVFSSNELIAGEIDKIKVEETFNRTVQRVRRSLGRVPKTYERIVKSLGSDKNITQSLELLEKQGEIECVDGEWRIRPKQFMFLLFDKRPEEIQLGLKEIVKRWQKNKPTPGVSVAIEKSKTLIEAAKSLDADTYFNYSVFVRAENGWKKVV